MNEKKLIQSIVEAEAFLKQARKLLDDIECHGYWRNTSAALRDSVRRSSMDLIRSLANLRNYKTNGD